ncbi:MAG: acyl-CoA dehydrogenase family protein [Acidimicrobiia bacterium]
MRGFADVHDELRDVARDLLADDLEPDARWRRIADAGWVGLEVPEQLDGSGATFAETAVVLEELGQAATAAPFLGTAVLGVAAASAAEPGADRDELLRHLAVGSARPAVALAPHADSCEPEPPFRLGAGGRLHGRADLVVDAAGADHLLLLAGSADGPVLVHATASVAEERPAPVGPRPASLVVTPEPVLDATRRFAAVEADGMAVPAESVWRFAGDPAVVGQAILDRAAVAVAADAFGVASAMLDATVAYVGERQQFGRPVGSFQAVKHQCADVLVQLRIGRELLGEAVAAVAAGDAGAGIAASRAKSFVGSAAVAAAGTAMQLHGGIGYTWESGIHRHLKRALLDRALFGSPAVHRRRIADRRWPVTK